MSNFIVRVELSKEIRPAYTLLRDRLLNIGFTKRIKSSKGIEYRLPNGNYYIETTSDASSVLLSVQKIALSIDNAAAILVTEVKEKGMAWSGLQKC